MVLVRKVGMPTPDKVFRFACVLLWTAALLPALTPDEPRRPDLEVQVDEPSLWQPVLASVGLKATRSATRFRIVVGDSPAAREAGFHPGGKSVRVASVLDRRAPKLPIFWEKPTEVPVYALPHAAEVFIREKHSGAPLLAGLRHSGGGLLWSILPPGLQGYERFPYLIHALVDLGITLPFRGDRTWLFFDYSYRTRVDLAYMARRWRQAGAAALHVSAWHFYETDETRDAYLRKLIEECHRQGILVYAWLELPHVSEEFWHRHPECREKTATLDDAQLDWRKLVNLAEPSCFDRVEQGVRGLLERFDWDGVNLAELYFESLHGPSNPARFTPMNSFVREEWRSRAAMDPILLFDPASPYFWDRNRKAWEQFADYRAGLALRLQQQWIEVVRDVRPELNLALTQIDDRFDTRMREYLGADAAALLPLAEQHDFTLVVEDPATLWDLGPARYVEIARRYASLAHDPRRLAIDINIVERYQQTYPTKKQVGVELFQLLQLSGQAFSRVMLYFEYSISRPDWGLLPFAAASVTAARVDSKAGRDEDADPWRVESDRPFGVNWPGPVRVNDRSWPVTDGTTAWLPPGKHRLGPGDAVPPMRLLRLTGDLLDAQVTEDGIEFRYDSASRAIALVDVHPSTILVDHQPVGLKVLAAKNPAKNHWAVMLPRGHHHVRLLCDGLLR